MDPSDLRKYGVPIYASGWVSSSVIRSQADDEVEDRFYAVLAGGGGEGRSGIPNAVLLSLFDSPSTSLSSKPIGKLGLGSELPYRMVVHPGGDGILCALPNRCQFYEWDAVKEDGVTKLNLKESEKSLVQLENIEQQLSLAFNHECSVLATGGEEGKLRVFKWPSMEVIIEKAEAHPSVKDLCFSLDGQFLVSLGRGFGTVWDIASSKSIANISKENDEAFISCRFSQINDYTPILYIAGIKGNFGCIQSWDPSTWKKISSKKIPCENVSSFDVSPDGKHLAIGTSQGDVMIISADRMRIHTTIRKAHIGIVTTIAFSKDSRVLISASMDSSARVTLVERHKKGGGALNLWMMILIVFFAIFAYFMRRFID